MDSSTAMERRLAVIEEAMVGDPRPGKPPGLVETQRQQGEDIAALKQSIKVLSGKVDEIRDARDKELAIRLGEQKAFKTLRSILYAALAFLGVGGGVLAQKILAALSQLGH